MLPVVPNDLHCARKFCTPACGPSIVVLPVQGMALHGEELRKHPQGLKGQAGEDEQTELGKTEGIIGLHPFSLLVFASLAFQSLRMYRQLLAMERHSLYRQHKP